MGGKPGGEYDNPAGKIANATVNLHLRILRMALETAFMQRVFDVNPANSWRISPQRARASGAPSRWTN